MKSVEEIIYERLPEHLESPLYWHKAPLSSNPPYVVYRMVGDANDKETLSRYGGQARVQFDIYADSPIATVQERIRLKDGVREIRGVFEGTEIYSAVVVNEVTTEAESNFYQSSMVDVIFAWTNKE